MNATSAILYDTTIASVLYIKKREYLYLTIEGFVNSETLSEVVDALQHGITHNHVKKIIFDTSKVKVIKKDDLDFIKQNLSPLLSKSIVTKVVFLNSDDIFGNHSIEVLTSFFNQIIPTRAFPDMEKAELWLFND